MATYINTEEPPAEKNDVNFIPCGIDFSGRAKVSSYFKEKPQANGTVAVSFRGRPLLGTEVGIPEGYCGYVLDKPDKTNSGLQVFEVQQSFKNFKYWNLDREPSKNDSIMSVLDWLEISKSIHTKEVPGPLQNGETVTNGNVKGDETNMTTTD